MTERLRPTVSAILAVYIVVLAGVLVATGEPGGESDVEWLYLLPVLTAVAMGLFLSVRRPENEVRECEGRCV